MRQRLAIVLALLTLSAVPREAWSRVGQVVIEQHDVGSKVYRETRRLPLNLSVLTYNIQARPFLDDTVGKFDAVGPLLDAFDIVAIQECFKDHRRLWANTTHPVRVYDGVRTDWYRVASSGLTTLARFPLRETIVEKFRQPEGVRFLFRAKRDGLVSKAIMLTRLDLGRGIVLDFYNLHLEAGGDEASNEARRLQTKQLINTVRTHSPPLHLVILAGDFNMRPGPNQTRLNKTYPPSLNGLDRSQLFSAIERELKLTNAGTNARGTPPDLIDHILYRSGTYHQLIAMGWRHDTKTFVTPSNQPWSDHDPVVADFAVVARE